jgi:hypothetical protein
MGADATPELCCSRRSHDTQTVKDKTTETSQITAHAAQDLATLGFSVMARPCQLSPCNKPLPILTSSLSSFSGGDKKLETPGRGLPVPLCL